MDKKRLNNYKKGLGPVVATALLIVVSVVSVIGFQSWFGMYSSTIFVETETKGGEAIKNSGIEAVIGDKIYFNNAQDNLTIKRIKVNDVNCEVDQNFNSGISAINLTNCESVISPVGRTEILIETEDSIFEETVYLDKNLNVEVAKIEGNQIVKLQALDGEAADEFGRGVAMWDDYIAVGAIFGDSDSQNDTGALYIFDKVGNNWVQTQKLFASDGSVSDWLGRTVNVWEDRIIVNAKGDDDLGANSGSAYIFEKNLSGQFEEVQRLEALDGVASAEFGGDVDIFGDYAVVGAFRDSELGLDSGAAYVFKRNSSGLWNQIQKLAGSDTDPSDKFAEGVGIYGDYIVVGATYQNSMGAAYVFKRNSSDLFEEVQKISSLDIQAQDHFGTDVDIYEDRFVVSAYLEDEAALNAGAVYVFKRNSSDLWEQEQKLMANNALANDNLGLDSVKISNKYVLAGARNAAGRGYSYVYMMNQTTNLWEEIVRIESDDLQANDQFGVSLDVYGENVVIGSSQEDDNGLGSGAAYVFE